ncbi:cell division topological specificity factor MinE [Vallitalea okinawensis]|uniref:cell division topological specificity factor MinE n=1 Tax=Vallitalea okinawensis TaxID=2078660 RepID=UPI000CFDD440|nr:cell division topological specificity factor MinE [Vallitalea okinawensis]
MNNNKLSGQVAKQRLKSVVSYDRIECAPDLLDMIKSDIVEAISKYIDVDESYIDIVIHKPKCKENPSEYPMISTSIPISYKRDLKEDSEE